MLQSLGASSHESTVVDFLEAEKLKNFLCLRSGISGLLDANDEDETVAGHALGSWEDEELLIFSCSCKGFFGKVSGSLSTLLSLVLHKVPLLLHVIGNVDLGEKNFFAASDGQFFVGFLLANLGHLLSSSVVGLLFLDEIVALSFLQESFLLDAAVDKLG